MANYEKAGKQLVGYAGELYAQASLNLRGYSTSKAPDAEKSYDLIASTPSGFKKVQVKTSQYMPKRQSKNSKIGWMVGDPDKICEDVTYIFVLAPVGHPVRYFIATGKEVKDVTKHWFKEWLKTPGRNGQKHSPDNQIFKFELNWDSEDMMFYEDRWELFEQ